MPSDPPSARITYYTSGTAERSAFAAGWTRACETAGVAIDTDDMHTSMDSYLDSIDTEAKNLDVE